MSKVSSGVGTSPSVQFRVVSDPNEWGSSPVFSEERGSLVRLCVRVSPTPVGSQGVVTSLTRPRFTTGSTGFESALPRPSYSTPIIPQVSGISVSARSTVYSTTHHR